MSNNKEPLVSIIMPAYNASKYVKQAIESITHQTYRNWELLISDDGSNDDTRNIISSYKDKRIITYNNDHNIGYLKTCNKLFKLCKGDFITFQDADDWSSPDRLKKQIAVLQDKVEIGICGTWARYIDLSNVILREKVTPTIHDEIVYQMNEQNPFCGATIMIRRQVYDAVGGYQEFFDRIGNEDYDWSLRIVEKFKACNVPEFLYNVQVTPLSISRTIKSPRQLISHELVHFLSSQRNSFGCDSLTGLELEDLLTFEAKLLLPFNKDKALIYRKSADLAAYNKEWEKVKLNAMKAWCTAPFSFINFKYLLGSLLRF